MNTVSAVILALLWAGLHIVTAFRRHSALLAESLALAVSDGHAGVASTSASVLTWMRTLLEVWLIWMWGTLGTVEVLSWVSSIWWTLMWVSWWNPIVHVLEAHGAFSALIHALLGAS